MFDDGSSFVYRYRLFVRELAANAFPNATTLAKVSSCSPKTAQRAIEKFQEKLSLPIAFCSTRKGYYLTKADFVTASPPPAQEELVCLLLMRNLAENLRATEIRAALDSLWLQLTAHAGGEAPHLEGIAEHFSADSTALHVMSSVRILDLVSYAARGEALEIQYKSPWKQAAPKRYTGRILRVHLSDGAVYLLFLDSRNREFILNAAFVCDIALAPADLPPLPRVTKDTQKADNWLQGFGVFSGAELVRVEIGIRRPAADFYASQIWHKDQVDTWHEDALVRTLPSVLSPELVRRILSLGEHVCSLYPKALRDAVAESAEQLVKALSALSPKATSPSS